MKLWNATLPCTERPTRRKSPWSSAWTEGERSVSTGVGFFDHMLTAFAVHGNFGLKVKTVGDWEVDCHHTVEDTGIVLGKAFAEALPTKRGIKRFGHAFIPMDEALAFAAVDISGRPFLVFSGEFPQERVGDFDTCMTEEFFRAFAANAGHHPALEVRVREELPPHDRGPVQGGGSRPAGCRGPGGGPGCAAFLQGSAVKPLDGPAGVCYNEKKKFGLQAPGPGARLRFTPSERGANV